MPRDAVSRTANVGTVGKNGLDIQLSERKASLGIMRAGVAHDTPLTMTVLYCIEGLNGRTIIRVPIMPRDAGFI